MFSRPVATFLCALSLGLLFSGVPTYADISLKEVPLIQLPGLDIETLALEDQERDDLSMAPRYAIPNSVQITPQTHGRWTKLNDEKAVWRLRFSCKNAISMNFGFSRWLLPIDGEMRIYNFERTHRIRPFDVNDIQDSGELWTPPVAGGDVVIEIVCPLDSRWLVEQEVELRSVNPGYRGFYENFGQTPSSNTGPAFSGSCNVDVVCPQSAGWENEIDCVGVISTGGSVFCTGFMVNNTAQDGTPFFMTADHCGITGGNAGSLVVFWNYENSTCRTPGSGASGGPGNGTLNQFSTGSIFRAGSDTTDFTLVELTSPPNAAFGVSFCGWNASPDSPTSAVGIHHPNTEEKRISFENQAPSLSANFVTVNDWDLGTTEPGSSGSPLFDQNHRVIGQLCCGGAACGNNFSDDYGRFSRSWTLGLSAWLDAANSGQLIVDTLPAGGGGNVELCSNGVDDDGDGLADCDDPDCANSPACLPAPPGDECSDPIVASDGSNPVDTTGMTTGTDPISDAQCTGTFIGEFVNDTWYSYTATSTGTMDVSTCDTINFDSDIAVYTGGCGALTQIACNGDGTACGGFTSLVSGVQVTAGTEYLIRVGGFNGAATGTGTMSITVGGGGPGVENCTNGTDDDGDGLADCADPDCAANPACGGGGGAGDDCIDAIVAVDGANAVDNTAATTGVDPISDAECPGTFIGQFVNDLWYSYTATSSGSMDVSTCDSITFDSDIAVYTGGCGTLTQIACNGDGTGCGAFTSLVSGVPVTAGTEYLIRLGGWDGGTGVGTGTMTITVGGGGPATENCANGTDDDGDGLADCADPDCANDPACSGGGGAGDDCIDAISVGDGATSFDTTAMADSASASDPSQCAGTFLGDFVQDMWFSYTPAASGGLDVSLCGSSFDTDLAIYTGGCGTLTQIACSGDSCALQSEVLGVPVTAGTPVLIRVGGWQAGSAGAGTLTITSGGGGPVSENCTNGTDDDGDGLADCADPDCANDPACSGGGGGQGDECNDPLPAIVGSNPVDTTAMTDSADPFDDLTCPGTFLGVMATDAWYQFTAPTSGTATIATCDQITFDSDLAAYTGTCGALTQVACNGDNAACGAFTSSMELVVTAGTTYMIRCGGWAAGEQGTGTLEITLAGAPTPENCTNGTDDDGDGLIDCEDADCDLDPSCITPPENCNNGTDDDGDGLADCNDPDCAADPNCQAPPSGFSYIASDETANYSVDTGVGSFSASVSISEDASAAGYPNETQGFSFGLSHTASLLSVVTFNEGSVLTGLNANTGADFIDINNFADGITVGCVYSFQNTAVITFAAPTAIGTISYDTVPSGLIGNATGTSTGLNWSNSLGAPPVVNILVVDGQAQPAAFDNGIVTLEPAIGGFVRGDINSDSSINIADAVSLLAGLFTGGSIDCQDAADCNDDGGVNIADAVYELATLFSGGPGMPAPSGPSCGSDPTTDSLDCGLYDACP
ncbi:MAG: dockerin type I repeat-containing protein [Planctomycetota bacterium]